MLETRIGKQDDRAARIKRGLCTWLKVKRWLWKSTLPKKAKALIVQATVEGTRLFDSAARPWSTTDTNKLQSVVDKAYWFIWNAARGLALQLMSETNTNSYQARKELEIVSLPCRMKKRALERIGHVLRMPKSRIVKRTVRGHWKR